VGTRLRRAALVVEHVTVLWGYSRRSYGHDSPVVARDYWQPFYAVLYYFELMSRGLVVR
jgi:hypothetical protein